jgi:hypothetical protein
MSLANIQFEGPATLTAAIIATAFAFIKYKLERDRMRKELFSEFNQRYSLINHKLFEISQIASLNDFIEHENYIQLYDAAMDYFNLCAEENLWRTKRRIHKDVWKSWQKGMNDWMKCSIVLRTLWIQETKNTGYISYYITNPFQFFDKRLFTEENI